MKANDIKTEIVQVSKDDTLSKVVGVMKKEHKSLVFVFDGDSCIGVIRVKDLLGSRLDGNEKAGNIAHTVPEVGEDAPLTEAAELLFTSNSNKIPVTDGENVTGSLSSGNLLLHLDQFDDLSDVAASSLMHKDVPTVTEEDTLGKIIEILHYGDMDRVLVVDEEGKMLDIISGVDIMEEFLLPVDREHHSHEGVPTRAHEGDRTKFMNRKIHDFSARREIISTQLDTKLPEITKMMKDNRTSSIVLTDLGEFKGIITKRDIIGEIAKRQTQEIKNIQYVDLNNLKDHLSEGRIAYIKNLCSLYGSKINMLLNQAPEIKVHFKQYHKDGTQRKYSVNIQVTGGSQGPVFNSNDADWDLPRTVHKAFNDIMRQIEHKLKVSDN